MGGSTKIKILFVCLGNICRSPMAEGMFRQRIKEAGLEGLVEIDSAGTHDYNVGRPPDARAQMAALRRGANISRLRGRQTCAEDIRTFDYILAMDRENYKDLRAICPVGLEHKLKMFLDYAPGRPERDVPDPLFGGDDGFDRVLDMIEEAASGLLEDLRRRL
ncbi:MAG: low molecular weight protein-tyrosine-phosphatase [Gammaproteobacteria bacterium]|nr:MAG: low molecular weight protein-tyrosine-phosphatase [Gammaproteobacteria bacterium]